MPRRIRHALLLVALLGLAAPSFVALAGCGGGDELAVVEGEGVNLGELDYNVQLSRFLNINDDEDRFYLTGQKQLPPDKDYFGVFIRIRNSSDTAQRLPSDFVIEDTLKNEFRPVKSKSVFALDLGGTLEAHLTAPAPDSPGESGPTGGALVLFVVNKDVTENRPLHLFIPSAGSERAEVKLDI
jgi:hypothetical protein